MSRYTDIRPLLSGAHNGDYLDSRADMFAAAVLKKRLGMLTNAYFEGAAGPANDINNEVLDFVDTIVDYMNNIIVQPNGDNSTNLKNTIRTKYAGFSPEVKAAYQTLAVVNRNGVATTMDELTRSNENQNNEFTFVFSPPQFNQFLMSGVDSALGDSIRNRVAGRFQRTAQGAVYNYNAPQSLKLFSFNLGKYFMTKGAVPVDDQLSKIFAESADPEQIWMRDGDKIIHRKTGEVAGTNVEAACAGTKVVDGANGRSCTSYVSDCLMGQNIDACRDYFGSAGFYTNTQEEIQKMDPVVAVKMLRKFGFKEVSAYDEEEKMNIVTIEIVAKWIEGLKGVADAGTIAAISGNDQLKAYLEWIVQLVNNNPAILNPGYGGNKGPDSHDPNRFGHTGFAQMGIRARRAVRNSCYRDIDAIANAIDQYNITLGIRLNAPIVGGIVPARIMVGGSMVDLSQAESSIEQLRSNRKQTSELLNKTYNYLTRKLQTHHKDISPKDKAKIGELIDDLAKKEEKLYEIIDFVEKYALLVDVFGDRKVEEVVKLEQMQKAVQARSKLFAKKVKRETDLVSVLRSLTGAVDDQTESGESNPVGTAAGMN